MIPESARERGGGFGGTESFPLRCAAGSPRRNGENGLGSSRVPAGPGLCDRRRLRSRRGRGVRRDHRRDPPLADSAAGTPRRQAAVRSRLDCAPGAPSRRARGGRLGAPAPGARARAPGLRVRAPEPRAGALLGARRRGRARGMARREARAAGYAVGRPRGRPPAPGLAARPAELPAELRPAVNTRRPAARAGRAPPARGPAALGLYDKDDPTPAFANLGPLVRRFPHAQTVRFHLGLLSIWIGSFLQARREFELVVAQNPKTEFAREAKLLLARLGKGGTG